MLLYISAVVSKLRASYLAVAHFFVKSNFTRSEEALEYIKVNEVMN